MVEKHLGGDTISIITEECFKKILYRIGLEIDIVITEKDVIRIYLLIALRALAHHPFGAGDVDLIGNLRGLFISFCNIYENGLGGMCLALKTCDHSHKLISCFSQGPDSHTIFRERIIQPTQTFLILIYSNP